MNENKLIELRDTAMAGAVSSAPDKTKAKKAIAIYIRAMRNAGEKYKPRLFHDMATIKHGFGILKTPYRKLMNRAHPNGHWK
jgi:hypothetical protein